MRGNVQKSQRERKVKTIQLLKARENESDEATIGFNCEPDWLRKWRELIWTNHGVEVERSNAKTNTI